MTGGRGGRWRPGRIGEYFGRNVATLNRLDPVLRAEDLDIPVEQADAMHRGVLTDIARWSVVPAKQLIDLLCNIGVPVAGDIVAATPPQSPPRSTLQELTAAGDPVADPEALGKLLRGSFADALHRAVDGPNWYGSLSQETRSAKGDLVASEADQQMTGFE